jgi:hypothetical protein
LNQFAVQVRQRAADRCEYCRVPQAAFRRAFHIEHIVARQHGGPDTPDNLALACWQCNLKKGPNLSDIDPQTGRITSLFHPRFDLWTAHFSAKVATLTLGIEIQGLTPVGRATVQALGMNDEMRQTLRYDLWREAIYSLDS